MSKLKKFNKKTFLTYLTNYLIMFVTILAILTVIFAFISEYIYDNLRFLNNFIIILGISAVASLLLLAFLKINKISIALQVGIVYLFLSLIVLCVGYILYIYDFRYNPKLFIATSIFLLIGLIIIIVFFAVWSKRSDKSLNAILNRFKERDRK